MCAENIHDFAQLFLSIKFTFYGSDTTITLAAF